MRIKTFLYFWNYFKIKSPLEDLNITLFFRMALPYFVGSILSCHPIHSESIYLAISTYLALGLTSCSAILNALSCRASLSVLELAGVWIRLTSLCSHSSRCSRIFFSSEMYILATVSSLSSVNAQAQTIKHHTRYQKTWKQQIHFQTEDTTGSSRPDIPPMKARPYMENLMPDSKFPALYKDL